MIALTTKQPAAHIVTATQEIVDALLALNTHNRKFKPTQIEALRRDVDSRRFILTNQGVGVTASGFLSDGQNRLLAIRAAGYPPVQFVLVTGLDDNAQVVVDRHSRRTQVDNIKLILNRTVSNQIVAAANILLKVETGENGFWMKGVRTSEFDVAEFIAENTELLERVMPSCGTLRAPVTAALIEYAMRHDADSACELADQLRLGLGLTSTMPAYRMRQWLKKNSNPGGTAQLDCYCAAISCCIAHARGEPMMMIRPSSSWDHLPKKVGKRFPASDQQRHSARMV